MRSSLWLRFLALPLATFASRLEEPAAGLSIPKERRDAPATAQGTTFNGQGVPPPTELSGDEVDKAIASGNWLVEFFSPYCHHCTAFAPTWQTLYEYYYTQDPVPQTSGSGDSSSDLNSFTRFYDFRFAKVDCVANADKCAEKQVTSFPTLRYYKNGEMVKANTGARNLKFMSSWVEEILESIRPGSRPSGGPVLPDVGADHAEPVKVNVPEASATVGGKSSVQATKIAAAGPSKGTPNAQGRSVALTAENFQRQVTMTRDPWFIKFYAPWCHHCQAMAPNWQGMAREMKGKLNVGEVNCEVDKRLCKDVKVRGYPTIYFFQGGERIEYDGLRGLGDLISYANKALAVREGVRDVSAADFEEMEKKEEVIFLYFYDHATTTEDFAALDRLVMSLVGHAKLVKTNDPALSERFKISTWPRLLVSRDGKPTYYHGLAPNEMRDFRRVLSWMQTVWLPIVPELTAANAHEIMDNRLVVLGILSRQRSDEFIVAKREIKNAALEWIDKQTQAFQLERQELRDAKQLRIEEAEDRNDQRALRSAKTIRIDMDAIERKEVGFAWVDGVFWERWIRTTFGVSVADGEKVVVNDEDNKRYWDVTMTGNPIVPSRTSILETLPRIVANPPKINPKSTTTALGHVWWVLRGHVLEHPLVSAGIAVGLLIGFAIWSRKAMWRVSERGGGYFRVGEKGGPMDGLLGGNGPQGKVD